MRRAAIVLVAALALRASVALGEEADPVIVLVADADDAFTHRVSAELESIGFHVVVSSSEDGAAPERTVAIARIVGGPHRRLEVVRGPESETPGAPLVIDAAESDAVSSIRVSEKIRAYFQPLRSAESSVSAPSLAPVPAPRAAPAPPPPPPPLAPEPPRAPPAARSSASDRSRSDARAAPSPRSWTLGIGAGLSVPFDVGGASLGATASFYAMPLHWIRLSPFVSIPILASRVDARGGSAALYAGMIGASATFAFVDSESVGFFGGAGFAGVWLRAVGHPESGFDGRTDDAFTSTALLDLLVRIRLGSALSLVPEARLGATLPPPDVRFVGTSVDSWGLPWGSLGVSLEGDLVR